jgi:hypothetical protein
MAKAGGVGCGDTADVSEPEDCDLSRVGGLQGVEASG